MVFGTPTRFGNVSAQLKQFLAGNPYGASHTSENGAVPPDDIALQATDLTARRAVHVAQALKLAELIAA